MGLLFAVTYTYHPSVHLNAILEHKEAHTLCPLICKALLLKLFFLIFITSTLNSLRALNKLTTDQYRTLSGRDSIRVARLHIIMQFGHNVIYTTMA